MLTASVSAIVSIVDVEPADPVIELARQVLQTSRWYSKQRVDLVCGQLKSELEAGTGRVPKEISPKTGVRQQPTECTFHVSLTHASCREARIEPSVIPRFQARFGAASHVDVRIHTRTWTCERHRKRSA